MITNVENEIELMARHLTILHQVIENEPIGIVAISIETGHPHHKVRYSLRVLEKDGIIEPTDKGAIKTKEATAFIESSSDRIEELISKLERLQTEASIEPHNDALSAG